MTDELDIVSVGNAFMDILHTPQGNLNRTGGSGATIAIRLARLGLRTGFIGRIGNDEHGNAILNELNLHGVSTERLRIDEFPTALINIRVASGERFLDSMESYRRINYAEEDAEYIKKANSIYIRASSSVFLDFSKTSISHGKKLFVSLNVVDTDKEDIELLCSANADILFCNDKEFKRIEHIDGEILNKGTTIAVTQGENGCVVFTKNGEKEYPAFKVDCIDPTGAGDAFAAGFIYGHMKVWALDKTAEFANACGAIATTEYGARSVVPTLSDVEEFIKSKKGL